MWLCWEVVSLRGHVVLGHQEGLMLFSPFGYEFLFWKDLIIYLKSERSKPNLSSLVYPLAFFTTLRPLLPVGVPLPLAPGTVT